MALRSAAPVPFTLALLLSLGACTRAPATAPELPKASAPAVELPTLAVKDLLAPGAELAPSARARSLSEQRVRLVGFMADMELGSRDALYLVPQPVHCDEGGGGTGDLPPDAVLLTLPSALTRPLEHVAGPVEAVGVLEVGNRSDAAGRIANFRLRLDRDVQKAL